MDANSGEFVEHTRSLLFGHSLAVVGEQDRLPGLKYHQQAILSTAKTNSPQDRSISQLIAQQAHANPEALALVAGNRALSYSELHLRSNQLAHYLCGLGVGPNTLVACCLERSLDLVIGLLGILKAGGAYVPLDPAYPPERLAFMLEDCHALVVVTQQKLVNRLPAPDNAHIVCLESEAVAATQPDEIDLPTTFNTSDLAYVIYTSGSTGRPKGTQITHESLLNLISWHQRAFDVTSSDRASQITSPAFDATVWELWPYLATGARIYLVDDEIRVQPTSLQAWLINNEITITFLPTVLAESVMALQWPTTTSLRFLLTGADTLHHYPSPDLPFAVINNYGPTEATVVATSGQVYPTTHVDSPPSIGTPIANTQIYLLDEHWQQVPRGMVGELHIGGAGLALGYLHRPELTAERFLPHPFSNEPGARLYKTGDLARYQSDGRIAFLGRVDHQVKIRGFRIELGEIEAALNRHTAISQAVVIARGDEPDDKHLVAYIVAKQLQTLGEKDDLSSDQTLLVAELQQFLRAYLPDYMVPTSFVLLDAFPLTPHGKVDRAALSELEPAYPVQDEASVAPSTLMEEQITEIVTSLMKLERVGIDDNFFMLGGHSLLGTQIIAKVADTFEVDLTLRTLFEAPTIRQLAAEVERLVVAQIEMMSDDEIQRLLE